LRKSMKGSPDFGKEITRMKHTMTRITSFVLALVMVLSMASFPVSAAASYSDVQPTDWYADAVAYVTEKGLMDGVSDGVFAPEGDMTRAMFVTVMSRIAKAEVDNDVTVFDDVPAGEWYTGAVTWAARVGITNGVSDTEFAPNNNITRQDMCTILARFANVMDYKLPQNQAASFADAGSIARYARAAVSTCAEAGLINGFEDGTFRPRAATTRAQIAAVVMRMDVALNGYETEEAPRPAQYFRHSAGDDMTVTIDAMKGALPYETELTVSRVTDSAKLADLQSKLDGEIIAAADISFSKDGVELEPAGNVSVEIDLANVTASNLKVYHVKDDNTIEPVGAQVLSATRGIHKTVRFQAKDFSIYVVVDGGDTSASARIQVNFVNPNGPKGNEPFAVMYAKNGDDAADLKKTIYDPGIGETLGQNGANELFVGWILSDVMPIGAEAPEAPAYTVDTAHKTIQDVRDYLETLTITEGTKIYVFPMIFKVYTVSYVAEDNTTIAAKAVQLPRSETNVAFKIEQSYTPASNLQNFMGWIPKEGDTPIVSATYNGEDVKGDPYYKVGTELVIKGNTTFQVDAPKGQWLIFEENLKGATYNAPQFVEEHTVTSEADLLEMKCKGYTFTHWCNNKDCTNGANCPNKFVFGNEITANTTIYAQWDMDLNATYTVLVWKQSVDDRYDCAEADKTYDFAFAVEKTVTRPDAHTEINVTDSLVTNALAAYQNKDGGSITENGQTYSFHGFKYNTAKGNNGVVVNPDPKGKPITTILANGTTVINLYYDREVATYTFHVPQFTKVNNPNWNSSTTYFAYYPDDDIYYQVYSSRYFYVRADEIDRSKDYYWQLNSTTWCQMTYSNGTWYVYYNGSWLDACDQLGVNVAWFENGRLYERHDARYGETLTTYTYSTYSGNPTSSNYNRSNYFWVQVNGQYLPLTLYSYGDYTYAGLEYQINGSGTSYTFAQLRNAGYTIYTRTSTNSTVTYDVYTRQIVEGNTYTGLYDQKLLDSDPSYVWPDDYRWVLKSDLTGSFISIQEKFLDSWNQYTGAQQFHTDFYGTQVKFNTAVWHIMQELDGTYPDVTEDTIKVSTTTLNPMVFREFAGFTEKEYRVKLPQGVTTYRLISAVSGNSTDGYTYTYDGAAKTVNSDGWTEWIPSNRTLTYDGDEPNDMGHHAPARGIEFRYERVKSEITYMVGKFVDKDGTPLEGPLSGELHKDTGIYYDASLADYAEDGSKYYDLSDKTIPKEFVFAGWYTDDTCTTLYNFAENDMPINGVVVYAKFVQKQYRVYLHPNTTDPNMTYGSENQSTCFRVDYNAQISAPNPRRDDSGYVLVGWYTDEAMTHPFTQGTFKANDTNVTKTYNWDVDGTEFDKYGRPVAGAQNEDKAYNRVWIERKLDLYAKWRQILVGADGIGVEYTADDGKGHVGTNAPTSDHNLYQDNADAIAQGACTAPAATGTETPLQFLYWVVQKWTGETDTNGQPIYEDTDKTVYPGGNFSVLAADAYIVDGENDSKTYTVRLRAEYGAAEDVFPTHITWHGNGGTTTVTSADGNVYSYKIDEPAVRINEAIDIRAAESFTRPGYTFLGWARVDETDENGVAINNPEEMDLGVNDLWLTYHPAEATRDGETNEAYFTVKDYPETFHATQIAADENFKYHTLYAVWQRDYFYVLHSSTGVLEAFDIPTKISNTGENSGTATLDSVDLTTLVSSGYLYGGYYSEYGGANMTSVMTAANYAPAAEGWVTPTTHYAPLAALAEKTLAAADFEAYTGAALKSSKFNKAFWTKTLALTDDGSNLMPTKNAIYVLKEVPEKFLTTKYVYVYDTNNDYKITNLYLISVVDDANYNNVGFVLNDAATLTKVSGLSKKFTVIQKGNDLPADDPRHRDPVTLTVTAADFGVPSGYLAVLAVDKMLPLKNPLNVKPSWTTFDGVAVGSRGQLELTELEDETSISYKVKEGDVLASNKLYINTSSVSGVNSWEEADAVTKVHLWNGTDSSVAAVWITATKIKDNLYCIELPLNYTDFLVARCNPNNGDIWNQSGNLQFSRGHNYLTQFTVGTYDASWSVYYEKPEQPKTED